MSPKSIFTRIASVMLSLACLISLTSCNKNRREFKKAYYCDTVPIDEADVGDYVEFGKYIQNKDEKEPIIWLVVLIQKNGDMILASKNVIEYMDPVEAEKWLSVSTSSENNDTFLGSCFSKKEKKAYSIYPAQINFMLLEEMYDITRDVSCLASAHVMHKIDPDCKITLENARELCESYFVRYLDGQELHSISLCPKKGKPKISESSVETEEMGVRPVIKLRSRDSMGSNPEDYSEAVPATSAEISTASSAETTPSSAATTASSEIQTTPSAPSETTDITTSPFYYENDLFLIDPTLLGQSYDEINEYFDYSLPSIQVWEWGNGYDGYLDFFYQGQKYTLFFAGTRLSGIRFEVEQDDVDQYRISAYQKMYGVPEMRCYDDGTEIPYKEIGFGYHYTTPFGYLDLFYNYYEETSYVTMHFGL